jgi:hypothetical protein
MLTNFFDGMMVKLDTNSHKNTPTIKSIPEIIDNLMEEVVEFEEQLARDKFNNNTLVELMDTANFAFLAYVALRLDGVKDEGVAKSKPEGRELA